LRAESEYENEIPVTHRQGLTLNEIYLDDARLFALADAIAAIRPCPFAGRVTRDQIIVALGEHGDVWPSSILPELIRDSAESQERPFQTLL
jgi:hypothetical protein